MDKRKKPFEDHLEKCAQQPDPKKAFRGGFVSTILENHPGADPAIIEEMLDQMGA